MAATIEARAVRRWDDMRTVCTEWLAILPAMARDTKRETSYEVVCPHCNKPFEAELLSGESGRHQGFKCPHCRLFVAYGRAEAQNRVEPQSQ
jgi:DNA-directed RNA polymerase subunit RPC12/RpoP